MSSDFSSDEQKQGQRQQLLTKGWRLLTPLPLWVTLHRLLQTLSSPIEDTNTARCQSPQLQRQSFHTDWLMVHRPLLEWCNAGHKPVAMWRRLHSCPTWGVQEHGAGSLPCFTQSLQGDEPGSPGLWQEPEPVLSKGTWCSSGFRDVVLNF